MYQEILSQLVPLVALFFAIAIGLTCFVAVGMINNYIRRNDV